MEVTIELSQDATALASLNETVQELHCALYPKDFKPFDRSKIEQAFEKLLAEKDVFAFIARVDEVAVGYILCMINRRKESEFQFEKTFLVIDQISVNKAYRDLGIGKLLMEKAIALARDRAITELQLNHWVKNEDAKMFFMTHGFQYFNLKMCKRL